METQSVLAIPEEDNCILVYSSSKCPEMAQKTIAKCLGIPFHNVRVITRRIGGGFDGKALRSVPGPYIADAIIQDVASFLSKDSHSVKKKNLHTHDSLKLFFPVSAGDVPEYTLPSIIDDLVLHLQDILNDLKRFSVSMASINGENEEFPGCQLSTKLDKCQHQGKYLFLMMDQSSLKLIGGIELGQGLWTKVKQMAAFALGQLWDDGSQNLLDKVRVVQADTLSLIQGGITSGSTTSESSCAAVLVSPAKF